MSTLSQPNLGPSWKEEVSRRIAEHKNRKGAAPVPVNAGQSHTAANSRAADAAARVAARYAAAPSYSQMQAEEARMAVRAAEIATQVALEAQAAAESALAELHAASNEQPSRGPAVVESIERAQRREPEASVPVAFPEEHVAEDHAVAPQLPVVPAEVASAPMAEPTPIFTPEPGQSFGIRWEPDMPALRQEKKAKPARAQEDFELSAEDWWTPAETANNLYDEPILVDESQPAHANLIQFPRELVATRKMRPRLAEPPAAEPEAQLSIFEVDPHSVATVAEPLSVDQPAKEASWAGAEWSGMELEAQPLDDAAARADSARAHSGVFLAPLGLRLMATVVDGALIVASFLGVAMTAASHTQHPLAPRSAELVAALSLFVMGLLYHACFFTLGKSTPGMKYAGIGLCTFENDSPDQAQMRRRLVAMVLSILPLGLGLVWSVFDDDHLSWHDRISQTYLRKR